MKSLPAALPLRALVAAIGGFIGAELGSRKLGHVGLQRILAVVMIIGGLKLILT